MLAKYKNRNYTEEMAEELDQCPEEYMKVVRRMPKEGLPITRTNIRRFTRVRNIEPIDICSYFLHRLGTRLERRKIKSADSRRNKQFELYNEIHDTYMDIGDFSYDHPLGRKTILLRAQRALIEETMEILGIPEGKSSGKSHQVSR